MKDCSRTSLLMAQSLIEFRTKKDEMWDNADMNNSEWSNEGNLKETDLFRLGNALLNITESTYVHSRIHHRRRHHHLHHHQWYHHHYAFKNLGLAVYSLLIITVQSLFNSNSLLIFHNTRTSLHVHSNIFVYFISRETDCV